MRHASIAKSTMLSKSRSIFCDTMGNAKSSIFWSEILEDQKTIWKTVPSTQGLQSGTEDICGLPR